MKIRLYLAIFWIWPSILFAQTTDSTFSKEKMLWYVKNYHPISLQSNIQLQKGANAVMTAKGNFDPTLSSNFTQKEFEDKNYFNLFNGGLKIPTWFGPDIKMGVEENGGIYLNSENTTPAAGLLYGGLSIPIGQGLMIDKRRAAVQQAKIYNESTIAQQESMLNDLFYEAVVAYWYWVEAYNQLQVYDESVTLAEDRFDAIKRSFQLGANPSLDTLEAYIQVQNRILLRNQNMLKFQKASLELSNFLWYENYTPLEITDRLSPPSFASTSQNLPPALQEIESLAIQASELHPDLKLYSYKLESMGFERRLKAENLKPVFNVNYNVLSNASNSVIISSQNYKWGADFSFPILLRSERGALKETELKIKETTLDQQYKQLEIQNKIKKIGIEQINLFEQQRLYASIANNYRLLLNGEKQKFELGESSIFLINSRENNLIQAQIKYIEVSAKYQISADGVNWAAGILHLQ